MAWLYQYGIQQFLVFTLVLFRISGLVATAPVFGTREVPYQIRGLLAVALALVVTPSQLGAQVDYPGTMVNYLVFIGGELLIGMTLGLGVQLLLVGAQLAGQMISHASGMSMASVFDPSFEANVPIFSQFLYFFTLVVFLTIGGHRLVMAGLLGTFESIPLGTATVPTSLADTFTTLVAQSVELGVRAAAPTITALLLATLSLGLISRTLPQLNIMIVGFGINALATTITLALSLGVIAWTFQGQIEPFVEQLLEMLTSSYAR